MHFSFTLPFHCSLFVNPFYLAISMILSARRARDCWFLVPIFAPFLGSIIGVVIYQLMVGFHTEGEARDKKQGTVQENLQLANVASSNNSKEATKEIY